MARVSAEWNVTGDATGDALWGALEEQGLSPRSKKLAAEEDLRCRDEFLLQIRKRPQLVSNLGLVKEPTNAEILRVFKITEDPRSELRKHGLEPDEALEMSELVDAALRAVPPTPSSCLERPGGKCFATSVALMLLMVLLSVLAAWHMVISKHGWREGTCNIRGYHAGCNTRNCTFDIEIRERNEETGLKQFIYQDWAMPLEVDPHNPPRITIAGSAFRCCNPSGTLNCCQMYDEVLFSFCDNVPQADAPDGTPCPTGSWVCLFKATGTDAAEVITEVINYEPPDVLVVIIGAGLCLFGGVFTAVYGCCKKTRCMGMERAFVMSRRKHLGSREKKKRYSYFTRNTDSVTTILKKNQDATTKHDAAETFKRDSVIQEAVELRDADGTRDGGSDAAPTNGYQKTMVQKMAPEVSGTEIVNAASLPEDASVLRRALDIEPSPNPPQAEFPTHPDGDPPGLENSDKPKKAETIKKSKSTKSLQLPVDKIAGANLAFATGDLSRFVSTPSVTALEVPIIEPLDRAVAARRQDEIRRQNFARLPRPTSAPAGSRAIEIVTPSGPAVAWITTHSSEPELQKSRRRPESAPNSREKKSATKSAGGKRPDSAMSWLPESVTSTSATSRRPGSAMSKRQSSKWSESVTSGPESSTTTRPHSAVSKRPESGLRQSDRASGKAQQRPESGPSRRPQSPLR